MFLYILLFGQLHRGLAWDHQLLLVVLFHQLVQARGILRIALTVLHLGQSAYPAHRTVCSCGCAREINIPFPPVVPQQPVQ